MSLNPFLALLISLCIKERIAHKEAIDAIAIHKKRAERTNNPHCRYLSENEDDMNTMRDIANKFKEAIVAPLFEEFADKIKIDLKGHNRDTNYATLAQYNEHHPYGRLSVSRIADRIAQRLSYVVFNIPSTATLDAPMDSLTWQDVLRDAFELLDYHTENLVVSSPFEMHTCADCGQQLNIQIDMDTLIMGVYPTVDFENNKPVFTDPTPCAFPDGINEYSVEIDVPSGRLVMANALTRILPREVNDASDEYIKERHGCYTSIGQCNVAHVYHSDYYATLGIAYMQAGNMMPSVFQDSDTGNITVKDEYHYNSETDEETSTALPTETKVGDICMELWASTAMCYDTFVRYCTEAGLEVDEAIDQLDALVIETPAGRYKSTNYYLTSDNTKLSQLCRISDVN